MADNFLDTLMVKKPPKKQTKVRITMPEQGVEVKTKLIDKRQEQLVDRKAFMKDIKTRVAPAVVPPVVETTLKLKPPAERSSEERMKVPSSSTTQKVTIKKKKKKGSIKLRVKPPSLGETAGPGEPAVVIKAKRKKKSPIGVVKEAPLAALTIGTVTLGTRLGEPEELIRIRAPSYYMNNRQIFINFMSSIFEPYKAELIESEKTASCEHSGDDTKFSPMAHQKIVRDYINQYTPYRGLLLYHGLGSGKTCSSIAIAEGIKTDKQVIIMTPASLRTNYNEELKKCGDTIYRKNQFWEFIDADAHPELVGTLSAVLSLSVDFINKQKGAWLVNVQNPANYSILSATDKSSLDKQIDEMIHHKYRFINYNGLRSSKLRSLTANFTKNPFDNAIVIIDEAHNFVSRIVNKLQNPDSLSMKLYEYLMDASNAKIVFLTGTPIINYPNEISVMFNILRGKIKTWSFPLTINQQRKITLDYFKSIFKPLSLGGNILDYMEYKPTSTTLVVTRNPFGFVNRDKSKLYDGVYADDRGNISDEDFVKLITRILTKNGITVVAKGVSVQHYKALPDSLEEFRAYFIDSKNTVQNMGLFKRRILGLASYFRSAQESLMPRYTKGGNFHIIKIKMSEFQFGVYEEARVQERKVELRNARKKKKKKDGLYEDTVSTYRIFSRAFCNFVFPRPDIKRPMPNDSDNLETAVLEETANEDLLDATTVQEKIDDVDGKYEADELVEMEEDLETKSYTERINEALSLLERDKSRYLTPDGLVTYSPKFLNILENLQNPDHRGLHLIYSQFRTLEGIGDSKDRTRSQRIRPVQTKTTSRTVADRHPRR